MRREASLSPMVTGGRLVRVQLGINEADGLVVAEIPGREFELWAIGRDDEEALEQLAILVMRRGREEVRP